MGDQAIFSNYTSHQTENITASGAVVMWNAGDGSKALPLLMNQISITYSRSIQPIYPINVTSADGKTLTKLQLMGAPQGVLQCAGIITPNFTNIDKFLEATGRGCGYKDVTFTLQPYNGAETSCQIKFGYELTGLTLQSIGINIQGNEIAIISQPLNFTFTTMKLTNTNSANNNPNNR